jgi:hypothetical protein
MFLAQPLPGVLCAGVLKVDYEDGTKDITCLGLNLTHYVWGRGPRQRSMSLVKVASRRCRGFEAVGLGRGRRRGGAWMLLPLRRPNRRSATILASGCLDGAL